MGISLFLMTNKGYQVLKNLIIDLYLDSIDKVVVGIDKSVANDYSNEIISLCKKHDINYCLHKDFDYNQIISYGIAVSWRWLIESKEMKLIVLHDSILPKYRGFAPLVNSLINGEKKIGVTALFASEEYDRGDIILQKGINVNYPIKIKDAIEQISLLYVDVVKEIIKRIRSNESIITYSQDEEKSSYSLWRDEEDYFIDWNKSALYIKRFIDAVGYPFQGAKCYINNEIVIINEVTILDDISIENRDIGKVVFIKDKKPVLVCKEGLLRIDSAIFEKSKDSILPLKRFRTRFK